MKTLKVGKATGSVPVTLILGEPPPGGHAFSHDAGAVVEALGHLPSGTHERVLLLLLNAEILHKQHLGLYDESQKLIDAYAVLNTVGLRD